MLKDTDILLTIIAEKARLAEGSEGVRSILLFMFRNPSLKNKILAQKTGIAIPAIAAVRSELEKAGIIEKSNDLGQKGKKWVRENLNLYFNHEPIPESFVFDPNNIPADLKILNNLQEYLKERPNPNFAFDQSHADFQTVFKRTLYMLKNGDLEGRRIIFLGDDDATSIAVTLTGYVKEISVIDIDKSIIQFLNEMKDKLALRNINILEFDLRNPIPEDLSNKFDVVVMDPPYTNQGLRLFLKRAKEALKTSVFIDGQIHPVLGKRCHLHFGNKPPKELLKIQSSVLDHGFTIKQMIPDFNHYKGASILGQFSDLYYLAVGDIQEYKRSDLLDSRPIYTSEVRGEILTPYLPDGHHFIGEMHFKMQDKVLENEKIQKIFLESLSTSDLIIQDVYRHDYHPHGYSSIAVLKTSHAAIHTWPEHGYMSIDIFICDAYSKGLRVIDFLKTNLNPDESEFFYIERGKGSLTKYKPITYNTMK